jgi:hypothetical protein
LYRIRERRRQIGLARSIEGRKRVKLRPVTYRWLSFLIKIEDVPIRADRVCVCV